MLGFDIQPEAITSTRARLEKQGLTAELICDSHANLLQYVRPGTADIVMFNFGWLPGADHSVFSTADSSIPALEAALAALRTGGVLSAILYSGRVIGTDEKQSILAGCGLSRWKNIPYWCAILPTGPTLRPCPALF